jgi:cytochrome c-type biogenesis protein
MNQPGILSALLAGFLSFLSPCVLPLVPAYLSFISGSTALELSEGKARGRIFLRSLAFSGGFTAAFTVLGIVFSGGAMFVGQSAYSKWVGVAGGIIVIFLGLNMILDFLKLLSRDTRLLGKFAGQKIKGAPGAFVLGLAFAAGWSPCIGPILASILLFAARQGNAAKAAMLLVAYSAGFAVPFLASGLFFDRLKPVMAFLKRKGATIRIVSGVVLVAFGLAMALGSLGTISSLASRAGYGILDFLGTNAVAGRFIGVGVWLLLAAAASLPAFRGKRKLGTWRKVFIAAGIAAAALESAGLISFLGLVAGWFTFAGA